MSKRAVVALASLSLLAVAAGALAIQGDGSLAGVFAVAFGIAATGMLVGALALSPRLPMPSLAARVAVMGLALLLGTVTSLAFATFEITRRQLLDQGRARLIAASERSASLVDAFVQRELDDVRLSAQSSFLTRVLAPAESPDLPNARDDAQELLLQIRRKDAVFIRSVGLVNADGQAALGELAESVLEAANVGEQQSMPNVEITGQPLGLLFQAPVYRSSGALVGRLCVSYRIEVLQSLMQENQAQFDARRSSALISANGTILAYGDHPELVGHARSKLEASGDQAAHRVMSLLTDFFQVENNERMSAEAALARMPWNVVVLQPRQVVLGPIQDAFRSVLALVVALASAALAAVFWIGNGLIRPIAELTAAATAIAGGEQRVPPSDGLNEIGALGRAFALMTERLRRTLEGLRVEVVERTAAEREARTREEQVRGMLEERIALQRRLSDAARMESIGYLAAGIAHDFNNLLTPIMSVGNELEHSTPSEADCRAFGRLLTGSAEQARGLIQQLLAFGGRQAVSLEPLDLSAEIQALTRLLRTSLRDDIALSLELEAGAYILGDRTQIQQVLVNLAVNARDAMPTGGALSIRVVRHAARRSCSLIVRDSGTGMPEEVLSHVFEPFFTTKVRGRGTGLGLSTVYRIVEQHQGSISLTSAPGKGTRFELTFPEGQAPASAVRARTTQNAARLNARVLCVDDEPAVANAIRRVLERAGATVVTASGITDAIEAARAAEVKQEPFDLLISDVVLRGCDGPTVARAAQEVFPGIHVLFMSGYPGDVVGEHTSELGESQFLWKPFTTDELLAKVQRTLDPMQAVVETTPCVAS